MDPRARSARGNEWNLGVLVLMRRFRLLLIPLIVTLPVLALGQSAPPFNERDVKKQATEHDKVDTWVLDFRHKEPRLIIVDIPGRGKKVVWYMWYQVVNKTGEPRTFIPDFELVTLDKHTVHHDQILPKAEEMIKRIEDPTGYLDIKNSVTITRHPIPVTKEDSAPKAVTGIAIWDDVFGDAPDTNRFSIFVSGLSNGFTTDDRNIVRRKTLQLNFKRLSDRHHLDTEVKFIAPSEWLYRASDLKLDPSKQPDKGKEPDKAKELEKAKEPDKMEKTKLENKDVRLPR